MNKIHALVATVFVVLSTGTFAQETDAARQQRMDAAYANSQHGTQVADSGVREDLHEAGHSIHQGVRATGHAVHKGVDKVTGK